MTIELDNFVASGFRVSRRRPGPRGSGTLSFVRSDRRVLARARFRLSIRCDGVGVFGSQGGRVKRLVVPGVGECGKDVTLRKPRTLRLIIERF